jgi:hypothetical protein
VSSRVGLLFWLWCRVAGRGGLASCPFPGIAARSRGRAAGSRTGQSPAGVAGAGGVLEAAARAHQNREVAGGPRLDRGYAVVARPMAGRFVRVGRASWLHSSLRLAPARRPGAWGGFASGAGRGQSDRRPRRCAGQRVAPARVPGGTSGGHAPGGDGGGKAGRPRARPGSDGHAARSDRALAGAARRRTCPSRRP